MLSEQVFHLLTQDFELCFRELQFLSKYNWLLTNHADIALDVSHTKTNHLPALNTPVNFLATLVALDFTLVSEWVSESVVISN